MLTDASKNSFLCKLYGTRGIKHYVIKQYILPKNVSLVGLIYLENIDTKLRDWMRGWKHFQHFAKYFLLF